MYIVVTGGGQVGTAIAKALLNEGHSVAIIESEPKMLEEMESLDVLAVKGNAACPKCLSEAGISSANMLVAVTGSDEVNIISCMIGKSKGCKTVARLRNPDYLHNSQIPDRQDIPNMDLVVSPDVVTANYIARVILLPGLVGSEELADGNSLIIEIMIKTGNPCMNRMLGSIALPQGAIVSMVSRRGHILEPSSAGPLRDGDRVAVVLESRSHINEVETAFGVPPGQGDTIGGRYEEGVEKIVIVGATRTGILAAQILEKDRPVVLVDQDTDRCTMASEKLDSAIVINGDATNINLFKDEGLDNANVLVATTDNGEYNMLACLLAKKRGIERTMATVDDTELRQLFEEIGIDLAVSPRLMTVDYIVNHICGKQVSSTMTTLQGSGITVIEIPVKETHWMVGKEYGNLKLPKGSHIGSVIRNGKAMAPTRFDKILPGDRMIIMVAPHTLRKVEKVFSYHSGILRTR
ncbi:MAG: Trk system potassium transporter TrkA [Thermoplasmata archaeon]